VLDVITERKSSWGGEGTKGVFCDVELGEISERVPAATGNRELTKSFSGSA